MSHHWDRVRTGVQCAYGCQIGHAEWAWFGKHPFVVCEPCAAKYSIVRPAPPTSEPSHTDALVPATPPIRGFTELAQMAEQFQASPQSILRRAKRVRTRR